jgi:hypothetical protein
VRARYQLVTFIFITKKQTKTMGTRTKGRVVLSTNPKENLALAQVIYDKHVALGAASPLLLIEGIDWSVTGPKIAPTQNANTKAEDLKKQMEEQYALRDLSLPEIVKVMKMSIAFLKTSFGDNPKKLGDWGVNVDDSPKAKKTKTPKS